MNNIAKWDTDVNEDKTVLSVDEIKFRKKADMAYKATKATLAIATVVAPLFCPPLAYATGAALVLVGGVHYLDKANDYKMSHWLVDHTINKINAEADNKEITIARVEALLPRKSECATSSHVRVLSHLEKARVHGHHATLFTNGGHAANGQHRHQHHHKQHAVTSSPGMRNPG